MSIETTASGQSDAGDCSPLREVLNLLRAITDLTNAEKRMNSGAYKLIQSLTDDPREFPKAVKIGTVHTDVATIRIDGVTSEPLEIRTGSDGGFDVYADSYDDCGLPGRIIIEIAREILPENEKSPDAGATE